MAAQMIDFSIIIPHYNIPHSLQRLLDTIPDEPNLEVIVIDDNSDKETEALKQIIDKYSNDRRIFLKNVIDNKGAGASRNIGIQHARGKWLIFADSDDTFGEDFYRIISGNKDRSEDLIFFMPYSINPENGEMSNRHIEFCKILEKYYDCPNKENEYVLRYQVVSPWSKLIRREMVTNNYIFFENSKVANDVVFCRKIGFYAKEIAVEKDTFYIVTERTGSLTGFKDKSSFEIRLNEFIKGAGFIRENVDADTWKEIGINGSIMIHTCMKNKYGILELFKTMVTLLKNGIRIA